MHGRNEVGQEDWLPGLGKWLKDTPKDWEGET